MAPSRRPPRQVRPLQTERRPRKGVSPTLKASACLTSCARHNAGTRCSDAPHEAQARGARELRVPLPERIRRNPWGNPMARPAAAPAASHWSGHTSPARPHCSKPFWPAPARSRARARSPTRTPSATRPPEARDHGMSVELNVADVTFLGDNFTFIDCPGSIEFQHEGALALTACDAAIVVCEPDPKRVPALQLILKQLEDRGIPRFLFLNKIDSLRHARARHPAHAAAGQHQAAGAAPDPDLGERRRHRLRRSRARARIRLPRAGQRRGRRDAGRA